jgi:hypothetical protein
VTGDLNASTITGAASTANVRTNSLNVSGVTTSSGGFVGNVTGNATGLSGTPNITVGSITAASAVVTGVVTAFDFYNDAEYPSVRPTLDLAFAQTKILDSRITFTRASTATYVNASGLIASAAVNEARFDHDPATGESLGLLVEEARTNQFLNSGAMVRYDGITNALTVTTSATTAPDGISASADLITPTTSNALSSNDILELFTLVLQALYPCLSSQMAIQKLV